MVLLAFARTKEEFDNRKLKFNKRHKFKLVQFTDTHFGEDDENDKLT